MPVGAPMSVVGAVYGSKVLCAIVWLRRPKRIEDTRSIFATVEVKDNL